MSKIIELQSCIVDVIFYMDSGETYKKSIIPTIDNDRPTPIVRRTSLCSLFEVKAHRVGKIIIPTSKIKTIVEVGRQNCTVIFEKADGYGWKFIEIKENI